jgi:hypothetical protein
MPDWGFQIRQWRKCRARSPLVVTLGLFLFGTALLFARSDCLSIQEASHHVGEIKCVSGKVVNIRTGAKGIHFVGFREDQAACAFTVVVFVSDLKDVGDVRRLEGHLSRSTGLSDGTIRLSRVKQLRDGATMIPPLPKNYDVENRGHYGAGRLRSQKPKKTKSKPATTATYRKEGEDPPE